MPLPMQTRTRVRRAFTLIELLVVIAIIGILASLTLAVVIKVLSKGPEVADIDDIKLLHNAVEKFKTKHGCYPPDLVKLCHWQDDYDMTNKLDVESVHILQKIWPQIFKMAKNKNDPVKKYMIPWAGLDPTAKPIPLPILGGTQQCVILQGDQCLVFFLGGPSGSRGFSDSALFPIHDWADTSFFTNQKPSRVSWYEFQLSRLIPFSGNAVPRFDPNGQFPSYLDNQNTPENANAKPYVYFASNKGYNFLGVANHTIASPLIGAVSPYYEEFTAKGPTKYAHHTTFQIISAGANARFGIPGPPTFPAGFWNLTKNPPTNTEDWFDNRSNFHENQLGIAR